MFFYYDIMFLYGANGKPDLLHDHFNDRLIPDLQLLHPDLFLLVKVKAEQIALVPMEIFEVLGDKTIVEAVV